MPSKATPPRGTLALSDESLTLRMPAALRKAIEREAARLSRERGSAVSEATVVREILTAALGKGARSAHKRAA